MSEWMGIGELIDKLQVDEIAESDNGDRIRKTTRGSFVEDSNEKAVVLTRYTLDRKWRIAPKYVSFDEVMIAHSQYKRTITYHHDGIKYTFEYSLEPNQFEGLYYNSICLHELIAGNWTIEE